jgi:hypothetical protein
MNDERETITHADEPALPLPDLGPAKQAGMQQRRAAEQALQATIATAVADDVAALKRLEVDALRLHEQYEGPVQAALGELEDMRRDAALPSEKLLTAIRAGRAAQEALGLVGEMRRWIDAAERIDPAQVERYRVWQYWQHGNGYQGLLKLKLNECSGIPGAIRRTLGVFREACEVVQKLAPQPVTVPTSSHVAAPAPPRPRPRYAKSSVNMDAESRWERGR